MYDVDNLHIGAAIKQWRIERKMTQSDLADESGLSLHCIEALEQEARKPSLDTFLRVCNGLDLFSGQVLARAQAIQAARKRT